MSLKPVSQRCGETRHSRPVSAFLGALVLIIPAQAWPQSTESSPLVRFEARLSIKAEQGANGGAAKAGGTFTVKAGVTAHPTKADLPGDIPIHVTISDLSQGSAFVRFWAEETCHPDRGYPLVKIKHIYGSEDGGQAVVARFVQRGKAIPADAIVLDPHASALNTPEKVKALAIMKTLIFKTRASHLSIEVRLSRLRC